MGKSLFLLVLILSCACRTTSSLNAEPRFMFDDKSMRCVDAENHEGLNTFDAAILFRDIPSDSRGVRWPKRDAQCTDFSNVHFEQYLGVGYNVLVGWDFRGSRFTSAMLSFNFIEDGLFLGSNVEELKIGYGRVTAKDIRFDQGDMPLPESKMKNLN